MRLALESGSNEKLANLAHGLKGVSASIFDLNSKVFVHRQTGKAGKAASASSRFAELVSEFSRISQFLKQYSPVQIERTQRLNTRLSKAAEDAFVMQTLTLPSESRRVKSWNNKV